MMLTGKTDTAAEALDMDPVNAVFPDDAFDASVAQFCADMLANS